MEPGSPELAGGFPTTGPAEKSYLMYFDWSITSLLCQLLEGRCYSALYIYIYIYIYIYFFFFFGAHKA